MHITVVGATGFIGKSLITRILDRTNYTVTAFSKSADKLDIMSDKLIKMPGDVMNKQDLQKALADCDAAYYLVHMMGATHDDYAKLEAEGAKTFALAAQQSGVSRVIYLGGLGDSSSPLSKHLASRQHTGNILRKELPLVIELRASMIIGDGSVAYEIIRAIANKLPVTAVPTWADTPTQPIGLTDMLRYLVASLSVDVTQHTIVEVGGPEVLTYPQILRRYTAWQGHKHHVYRVPFVPRVAARWWLNRYVSNKGSGIGGPMIESLHYPMVVTTRTAIKLYPAISPAPIEAAFT